ncbi:MAG: glycine C-acetyltransferase [Nitrospirales bacterium]|nr:glycine C-acetyltransferase [Nitrospira sp.]MDR4486989.1 glycine C-acetyltransferase [Nitrospirales bacterium]
MMTTSFQRLLQSHLEEIRSSGLLKAERRILGPQGSHIQVSRGEVINLCANNYLGLANHPEVIQAAKEGLDRYGYGMASVRFICGTQDQHMQLEDDISRFLGTDATILYSSCFDANAGFFETIVNENDAVISDALNHASLIDGIRLCKAKRFRYAHSNMQELERALQQASGARLRLIVTDGVFSMDGDCAKLDRITDLAEQYEALVLVDDSHATGVLGEHGQGTPAYFGVKDKVDVMTGTLGKALGGGSGGFTSGRREIIALLRQRSRPYLFSNAVPPVMVAASLKALNLVRQGDALRATIRDHTHYFRAHLESLGFRIISGEHPIIPIMLGDAVLATQMAERLLEEGVYVIGFSSPVVPEGQARIRVQISAAHTRKDLETALRAFEVVGRGLGLIP